jgi:hypothetical protein
MDDRLSLLLWTLAGAFSFALIGGLFGGLASWLSWRGGSASGSIVGRRVADALARLLEGEPTAGQKAVLTGAADGALFLGLLGTLIGLLAGQHEQSPAAWLLPAFGVLVLLAAGAILFGALASGLVRRRAVLGFCVGGLSGALFAAFEWGVQHIVGGAAVGIVLGALVSFALKADDD